MLLRVAGALLACGALVVMDAAVRQAPLAPAQARWPLPSGSSLQGWLRTGGGEVPMPAGAAAAHASSLVAMPVGHSAQLSLFWFSGERESGPLVQIAASQFDRGRQEWLPARVVANRQALGWALGFAIRRLGNPVAWVDPSGRLHLYVVATGAGGWAASRVLHLRQSSTGNALAELEFAPVRVLPLAWGPNISFLVRNAPLDLMDGGAMLPVHFEIGRKFPFVARLDAHGDLVALSRVSQRAHLLQPTLLARASGEWLALMRDERAQGKIGVAHSGDGGRHWDDLPDLTLDNPDAAVAAVALTPQHQLLAHNSSPGSRARLDLSHSADGRHWSVLATLASGAPSDEFSYPALQWSDGRLWISYTVDRARIAWQHFTPVVGRGEDVRSQP